MEKRKVIWIIAVILSLSAAAAVSEHMEAAAVSEKGIERNPVGGAERTEEFWYRVDGQEKKELSLEVSPQILSEDEAMELLKKARTEWESSYLAQNASAERVDSDLTFPTQLADGLVSVRTTTDQLTVLDEEGRLDAESIPDEGMVISLETIFSYESYELTDVRSVHVYRPKESSEQMLDEKISEAVSKAEEIGREKKTFLLPEKVDGHSVQWKKQKTGHWAVILLIGAALIAAVCFREKEQIRKQKREKEDQLLFEYPQMIEQICLLLGSGMTIRRAWERMVSSYRRQKERDRISDRLFMEEMTFTEYEMRKGRSERECYERFGARIGLEPYRRFAAILTRNLAKGNADVRRLLEEEADQAMTMRKNTALRLGEEASTKLLGPMLIMFLVILAAVIFPALENF